MTSGSDLSCPCAETSASAIGINKREAALRCRRCGLLARAQLPSADELLAWYKDEYWTRYSDEQMGAARGNVNRHALAWVEQYQDRPGTLLDVGCGGGALLELCRSRGWQAIGFDPSVQAVEHARACGLEVYAHPWPPCSLPDEIADAVTFINVLDHLRDPLGALQETRRVLRPGGLLYIRVPHGPVHARLTSLLSGVGLDHLPVFHLFGFGPRAFRYHLPRLGFRIIGIRTAVPSQGNAYPHAARWSRLLRQLLKMVDHLLYQLLASLGLDRQSWGFSIEVMACKLREKPPAPLRSGQA